MRVAVFNFCYSKYQTPRKFTWNLHYDVDNTLDVTPAKFEKSKFRNGWEIWIWSAEDRIGITKKRDVCGKGVHKFLKQSEKHSKVSRSLIFKWHKRFADGRDSLADDEWEGRPSFRESDAVKNEVRDVINGDRRLTVREVADKCGISKTTAHQILGNDLNMNRVCARWVPRILTAEHLTKRVELSKQFIKKVNRGGIRFLDRIITTDESWFHYYDPETKQQSSQWKNCNSPPPKKAKITKSLGKNMFILFMDRKGMLLTHAVPRGQTVNSEYYSKVINIIITFEINELIIYAVNLN